MLTRVEAPRARRRAESAMPRFVVTTHLACWQAWLVEADNLDDATARYADGELVAEHVPEEPTSIAVAELPPESRDQFDLFAESAD